MSRCTEYKDQVIELDFLYPSEGIHRRWDEGEPSSVACLFNEYLQNCNVTCFAASPLLFLLSLSCSTAKHLLQA